MLNAIIASFVTILSFSKTV